MFLNLWLKRGSSKCVEDVNASYELNFEAPVQGISVGGEFTL